MRAKMRVTHVTEAYPGSNVEAVHMSAVAAKCPYPEDGSDEDNTYAKFSPHGKLELHIANPALAGKIREGDVFYVDFTAVQPEAAPAGA